MIREDMSNAKPTVRTTRFAQHLGTLLNRSGLSVRQVATQSGIPHQTVFNWLNGRQPRWHMRLNDDLRRLTVTLGLEELEAQQLVQLAQQRMSARTNAHISMHNSSQQKESSMAEYRLPKGWFIAGSTPHLYAMGTDDVVTCNGRPAVVITSRETVPPDTDQGLPFGTLMQWCKASPFRGKRLRFSAQVMSDDLDDWAGLWMRVDGYTEPHADGSGTETLAFDNMESRPITGSSPWTQYEVVLDVPEMAEVVAYGILIGGNGSVWMSDVALDVVGTDVPTTARDFAVLDKPTNLSFAE